MKKILKNKKGFTLVELIVVIAILGILAVVMVPQFTKYIAKATDANDESSAKAYCTAYQAAYADAQGKVANLPAALTALGVESDGSATYGKFTATGDSATGVCTITGGTVTP